MANAIGKLKEDAQLTLEWLKHNNLIVNLKKTKFMLAGSRGGSRGGAWGAHAPPFGTEPAQNAEVCYALSARSYFDAVHISV